MSCTETVKLCFTAGDTMTINWVYTEVDGLTPIDLTGALAEMQLLDKITDVTPVQIMTGGLTDPANGVGAFTLTNTETQALLPVVLDANERIAFVSVIKITFADLTTKTIAGVDVDIEQGGIR